MLPNQIILRWTSPDKSLQDWTGRSHAVYTPTDLPYRSCSNRFHATAPFADPQSLTPKFQFSSYSQSR